MTTRTTSTTSPSGCDAMRLGINLGYWGPLTANPDPVSTTLDTVRHAETLGYDVAFAAEAYGSDAATVLAFLAASTQRIRLGSAVFQIPGRSAAMTAMTAATLDRLSGGRFELGLGVSGPQVSEGWHGVRFASPLGRTREYVDVVRMALARETVQYAGKHVTLPLPDGPGKALKLTAVPVQDRIPIHLAAVGPKNLELAGQIADGWLGIFVSPSHLADQLAQLGAKRGGDLTGFDVVAGIPVVADADVKAAADTLRSYYALYIGGMGSRDKNFYHQLATRLGFGAEADRIQDLYLAGRQRDAQVAVPYEFIDETALLGDSTRLAGRLTRFAEAGVTTLAVTGHPGGLEPLMTAFRSARL